MKDVLHCAGPTNEDVCPAPATGLVSVTGQGVVGVILAPSCESHHDQIGEWLAGAIEASYDNDNPAGPMMMSMLNYLTERTVQAFPILYRQSVEAARKDGPVQ